MYNEKKMKFWAIMEIVKKWFIILVLTLIGFVTGFVISEFVVDVLNELPMYRMAFIGGTAFVGFFIGLLITSNVERNVQDAFWKIEVMHKLEEIGIEELSEETGLNKILEDKKTFKDKIAEKLKDSKKEIEENKETVNESINKEESPKTEEVASSEQSNTVNEDIPSFEPPIIVALNETVNSSDDTNTTTTEQTQEVEKSNETNKQNNKTNISKKAKMKYKSKKNKKQLKR